MPPPFVPIRYRRVLPVDASRAYAWLTDYRDDDHQRTDAVVMDRKVVLKDENLVVLDAQTLTLGRQAAGVAEVQLFPDEHRWVATVVEGAGRGSVYEYRLVPLDPTRTRLDVVYRVRARRLSRRILIRLARPFIRRELTRMWDGFAASMARELEP